MRLTSYAVIFCFSIFDKHNRDTRGYFERFADFVNSKKIDYAVISGGFTEANTPELSEARTSAEFLAELLNLRTRIIIDEKATSSIDNVKFAGENVDLNPKNKVYVITDAVRFSKVYWLILHYWFRLPRKKIAREWSGIISKAYIGKKENSKTLTISDFDGLIKYKNVEIVIDPLHSNYAAAVQILAAWPMEQAVLYDEKLFRDWALMKKRYVLTKSNK